MSEFNKDLTLLENKKVQDIIAAAKVEFEENGIIGTKLKDIAKRAKVGEATLYRNFADKTALARLVAFTFWQEKGSLHDEYFLNNVAPKEKGIDKITSFLGIFKELYLNHRSFLKFLEDFDNYMMSITNIGTPSSFENTTMQIKEEFLDLVRFAKDDGTIKQSIKEEEIYQFMSQVMVSTTQKLAIRVGYLQSDEGIDAIKVLDNLVEMLVCVIENKE